MLVDILLDRLDRVRRTGDDKYMALCPAHDDRHPSLTISDKGDKVLIHCFAGCTTSDVLAAVGLDFKDLFAETLDPQIKCQYKAKQDQKTVADEKLVLAIAKADLASGKKLTSEDEVRVRAAITTIKKINGES